MIFQKNDYPFDTTNPDLRSIYSGITGSKKNDSNCDQVRGRLGNKYEIGQCYSYNKNSLKQSCQNSNTSEN